MKQLLTHTWRKGREAVLVFISRLHRDERELLTMRRADLAMAPCLVPAGIVQPRESLEEALWRVIRQQVGMVDGKLQQKGRLASYLAAPWQEWRHVFYLETVGSPDRWHHLTPPQAEEPGVTLAFSWRPFQVELARGQGVGLNLLGSPEAPGLPWPRADTRWIEQVVVFARNPEGRLLTFREEAYPHFGIQVPRGPLDAGESPQDAALRLVWEEMGLSFKQVRVVGALGEFLEPHHAMRHHVALLDAKGDLPSSWVHVSSHKGPDLGMRFCCSWSPPDVPLIPYQDTLQPLLSW
ncbi:MAG: NUDIX domain-containing protein [Coprothermobacterota bacterium]|nr:NUDIX domain-containing protein [Coprothermobacterota bacterium]